MELPEGFAFKTTENDFPFCSGIGLVWGSYPRVAQDERKIMRIKDINFCRLGIILNYEVNDCQWLVVRKEFQYQDTFEI